MKTNEKLLLLYYIISLIIIVIPLPWWGYNIGGVFVITDSPFQITANFMGVNVIFADIVNLFLNAFRIYVGMNVIYGLFMLWSKNTIIKYSTPAWLPVFYVIDPILIYLVFNYVVSTALGGHFSYPFLIIGTEDFMTTYQNTTVKMIISSYPTGVYWLAFIPTGFYLAFIYSDYRQKRSYK
ncbi:hypothetical protein [Stygiolobus caldivivus]|uniref:Uncharacterized protein n=1 Tax=Stygiolobus caldivivus TaxID=2824673 RepID=A0A8D5U7Z7_9CREN|nr:hypothetical protein [Stygiolobus caldivivus]BCU71455.1 hypothetical protein KN1_27520 [Stygiolobus caldivivus]